MGVDIYLVFKYVTYWLGSEPFESNSLTWLAPSTGPPSDLRYRQTNALGWASSAGTSPLLVINMLKRMFPFPYVPYLTPPNYMVNVTVSWWFPFLYKPLTVMQSHLSYLTWQGVIFCLASVHVQCTCSVYNMGIDYLIVLYEYLFCYNIRPSPVDYCEDYYLIPKCHYFENLRLCRSISLIWLCPVLPGIPLLGISWYLSIFYSVLKIHIILY